MELDQKDQAAHMEYMEYVFSLRFLSGGCPAEGLDTSIVRELLEETGLNMKSAEVTQIEPTKE